MNTLDLAKLLIQRLNNGKLSHDDLTQAGPEARKLMIQMINLGHGKGAIRQERESLRVTMQELAHA